MDTVFFVCVCVFFLLSFCYRPADRRDAIFLRAAMAFTVMADFCMLILYQNLLGLIFFCVVQTVYHVRYQKNKKAWIPIQIIVCVALFILLPLPLLMKLTACYAVSLLCSAGAALLYRRGFAAVGMVLFLCCDISVGLYNTLGSVFYAFIWIFYLPSQLLLAFSALTFIQHHQKLPLK